MKKNKKRRAALEDVLSGRTEASAARLIELIHQINPRSARGHAEARYALKSRLQSLLIERYGEDLIVEQDLSGEGIIGLRHRYIGRDAAHARILDLSPEAQVWVRKQLDRQALELDEAPAEAAPAPQPGPSALDALIEEGQRAMARFDFEEARACLELAAVESKGEQLVPYLELLVEHLGAFQEALDLRARFPQSALLADEVRALLALAAARAGKPRLAKRLMQKLEDARLAEIHAALAWYGVRAQDERLASLHLLLLKERDPTHTEVLSLERALRAR